MANRPTYPGRRAYMAIVQHSFTDHCQAPAGDDCSDESAIGLKWSKMQVAQAVVKR